jgi:hypothetical protein
VTFEVGDRIRINLDAKDYRVMWIGDRIVVLETEDKSCQLLTTMDHIKFNNSVKGFKNTEKM